MLHTVKIKKSTDRISHKNSHYFDDKNVIIQDHRDAGVDHIMLIGESDSENTKLIIDIEGDVLKQLIETLNKK